VEDVFGLDARVRENAEVDDDVAEVVREAAAEANAARLRRRRMGIRGDDANDHFKVQVGVPGAVRVVQSDAALGQHRRTLVAAGSAVANTAAALQSDFATGATGAPVSAGGKRERDDSGVQLAQPPRAAPNLREREEQLRQRAELIRQQRALQRRQQEERTVADETVRPMDTTAASATNGGVPSNDLMELEELAADDAPARAGASTSAPSSIPVAVWSTVDTTTDAAGTTAAPQAMPPSFGSSAPVTAAVTPTPVATSAQPTGNGAVPPTPSGPAKKKMNVFALAKAVVKETTTHEHVHGAVGATMDSVLGRRDEQGRLLSTTDAFKQISRQFEKDRR
jgi:hypothetical protein